MHHLTIRLGIALVTFSLGVLVYVAKVFFYVPPPEDEIEMSVAQFHEEEWHRLYEAAGMTGDEETLLLVRGKLMCANTNGVSDARPIENTDVFGCRKADGSIYVYDVGRGPYGQFDNKIMASHLSWSLKHLQFIKELIPAQRAKRYVNAHL